MMVLEKEERLAQGKFCRTEAGAKSGAGRGEITGAEHEGEEGLSGGNVDRDWRHCFQIFGWSGMFGFKTCKREFGACFARLQLRPCRGEGGQLDLPFVLLGLPCLGGGQGGPDVELCQLVEHLGSEGPISAPVPALLFCFKPGWGVVHLEDVCTACNNANKDVFVGPTPRFGVQLCNSII